MADNTDITMRDPDAVREDRMMYGEDEAIERELNEKYPNRPRNHSKTLPFHDLHLTFFNPLNENRKKPTGPPKARKKTGPNVQSNAPHEIRRNIIARFISRWRKEVGDDIYPAFRLLVPEKDRDRAMYGIKEMTLAKLLIHVLKIDKNSEDGYSLLHWKLPGVQALSTIVGNFAGRAFEVISKRPMRTTPGDMTIAEVNQRLDQLSSAQKEEDQRPIMEEFYRRMNAEELKWLICMILRQMKIGASERTLFHIWHEDAENLFNISSSLRRVCWELHDPRIRLEGDDCGIALMQCFQPQLAAFQMRSMEEVASRMRPTTDDPVFWIEEKLDGERMQLHMISDRDHPGGKRFCFWSRRAKEYTYLYGDGFQDEKAALTRSLVDAFDPGVRDIILDGEMITWDPTEDIVVPFGHLKTAALSEQSNPFANNMRPLFRVFDCLYLNGTDLTRYTLRNRRDALVQAVRPVHRRMEIHACLEARSAADIEPELRRVVATPGEGLVIKNPRAEYRLNERNDDWIKVKPEYMTEFGEALDCVVIGGYFGSGHRGGRLGSFLCGLRVDASHVEQGADPMKCFSLFKVGGGFSLADFAAIRHRTEGKWRVWDPLDPPTQYIELGGGEGAQLERPDRWIRPCDSVVLSVKAASVVATDQFRMGVSLRFPRFRKLRDDKDWESALSVSEFLALRSRVEAEHREKQFEFEQTRRQPFRRKQKRRLVVQGQEEEEEGGGGGGTTLYAGPRSQVLEGHVFHIMTECLRPKKMTRGEVEEYVRAHGGRVVASADKNPDAIVVADRNLTKVASIVKRDQRDIIRPAWLFDCVEQDEVDVGRSSLLLPFEPRHFFHVASAHQGDPEKNVDPFGDSYARDVTMEDLRVLLERMEKVRDGAFQDEIIAELDDEEGVLDSMPGYMFRGFTMYLDGGTSSEAVRIVEFTGGTLTRAMTDLQVSHVVLPLHSCRLHEVRRQASTLSPYPRIVTEDWVMDSWKEKTVLDEERYMPL